MKTIVMIGLVTAACALPHRAPEPPPPGLHEESVAWDPVREAVVLFGGLGVDTARPDRYRASGETWEWRPHGWRRLQLPGPTPRPRAGAGMAWDAERGGLLLVGGLVADSVGGTGTFVPCPTCSRIRHLLDSWLLTPHGWEQQEDGPIAHGITVLSNPRRREIYVLGYPGYDTGNDSPRPVWLWRRQGSGWTVVDSMGPNATKPPRAALDPDRNAVVLPILDGPDEGTWEWSGTWRRVADTPPGPRRRFVVAWHPELRRVTLFGGFHWEPPSERNDLWNWDGAQWSLMDAGSGRAPSPRRDGTLLYHPGLGALLHIGGLAPGQVLLRESWSHGSTGWTRVQ